MWNKKLNFNFFIPIDSESGALYLPNEIAFKSSNFFTSIEFFVKMWKTDFKHQKHQMIFSS